MFFAWLAFPISMWNVQAVLKALREREAQLLTVQSIEADIAKRQKALSALEEQAISPAPFSPHLHLESKNVLLVQERHH